MIKIRKEYDSFIDFMNENKNYIYSELLKLFVENENGDVSLEIDVEYINDRTWKSLVNYKYENRLETYKFLLNYFENIEEYNKCMIINELTEKYKLNCLESV